VLVAILKKKLNSPHSLSEILQILSVSVFDKTPVNQLISKINTKNQTPPGSNQLNLWDL